MSFSRLLVAAASALVVATGQAAETPPALQSLPKLDVPSYMGTWYQVLWFPNRFQKQCVADTTAAYRALADGKVEVLNRCRLADGTVDQVLGVARPTGAIEGLTLRPAQLEVSFLPAALRWLPFGWGNYWVIKLADDGRYSVVSEPGRDYLWVLARQPQLTSVDEAEIRSFLQQQGFDLSRLQAHPQTRPLR
jgi:apolipoprotein D and lipocalin family protein